MPLTREFLRPTSAEASKNLHVSAVAFLCETTDRESPTVVAPARICTLSDPPPFASHESGPTTLRVHEFHYLPVPPLLLLACSNLASSCAAVVVYAMCATSPYSCARPAESGQCRTVFDNMSKLEMMRRRFSFRLWRYMYRLC